MSNGTTKTSEEITKAPTMYQEIEQGENVARGHVEVIEIICYKATKEKRRHPPEKAGLEGEIMKKDGETLYVEVSSGPYFCQDPEDEQLFTENNPDLRTESFTVQLRKTTAIKYLDAPENMKQFAKEDESEPIEVDWRQQAKDLGIKMYQRSKVDVLADIAEAVSVKENGNG